MSHSKRNTSRAVFTSHERTLARAAWGTGSARLSRESFLPFGSCCLCLEPAIDPVACIHGDIFCRECALSNILAQKKEIKRLDRAREQEERETQEDQARRGLEEQSRAVQEFELTQAGLDSQRRKSSAQVEDGAGSARGEKRKFSIDEDEVLRIASQERSKARRAIDDEKAAKPTLPSFWSPSVTPALRTNLHEVKKKGKTQPTCPTSPEDKPHFYSLHTLVTVHFTDETDAATKTTTRICPACKKGLTNSSRAELAKPCGHVLCKSCIDKFVRHADRHDPHAPESEPGGMRCYVCDGDLVEKPGKKEGKADKEKIKPGLVELRREGTGFSASGANQVKKDLVNFQC
ncbi:hypothetical protein B0T18DRAFT_396259 [Schizothecium vesticola]|uniref:RING-type domain-containing protein n=1 Tax=Schizothecium vesticola TaxID=314040 RepID=A0AA40F8U5_9PEZI|nr:hypothetical protein B0T18DRAFT_396259 [Schizothecium vesticola]